MTATLSDLELLVVSGFITIYPVTCDKAIYQQLRPEATD
jgi:hypothetical protein